MNGWRELHQGRLALLLLLLLVCCSLWAKDQTPEEEPAAEVPWLVPLPSPFPDAGLGGGEDALCLGDHIFIQRGAVIRNITLFLLTPPSRDLATRTLPPGAYDVKGRTYHPDGTEVPLAEQGVLRQDLGTTLTFSQARPGSILQFQYTLKAPHPGGTLNRGETWKNPLFIPLGHPVPTKTSAVHVLDGEDNRVMFFPGKDWRRTVRPGSKAVTWLNSIPAVAPQDAASGPQVAGDHLLVVGTYKHNVFFSEDLGTWEGLGKLWYEQGRKLNAEERKLIKSWQRGKKPGLALRDRYEQVRQHLLEVPDPTMALAVQAFASRGLKAHLCFLQRRNALGVDARLPGMGWFSDWGVRVDLEEEEAYFLPAHPGFAAGQLPHPYNGGRVWVLTHPKQSRWQNLPVDRDPGIVEVFDQDYRNFSADLPRIRVTWNLKGPMVHSLLARRSHHFVAGTGTLQPELALASWLQEHCRSRKARLVPGSLESEQTAEGFRLQAEVELPKPPMDGQGQILLNPFGFSWLPYLQSFRDETRQSDLQLPAAYSYRETISLPQPLVPADWDHESSSDHLRWRQWVAKETGHPTLVRELSFPAPQVAAESYRDVRGVLQALLGRSGQTLALPAREADLVGAAELSPADSGKVTEAGPHLGVAVLNGPAVELDQKRPLSAQVLQAYLPEHFMAPGQVPQLPPRPLHPARQVPAPGYPLVVLDYLFPAGAQEEALTQALMVTAPWLRGETRAFFSLYRPEKKRDWPRLERWSSSPLEVQTRSSRQDPYKQTALQVPKMEPLPQGQPFGIRVVLVAENELLVPALPLQNPYLPLSGCSIFLHQKDQQWRPAAQRPGHLAGSLDWQKEGPFLRALLPAQPTARGESAAVLCLDPSRVTWNERLWPYRSWLDVAALFRAFAQADSGDEEGTPERSAEAHYDQVRRSIRYVPHALGTRGYLPFPPRVTENLGWGDCKDMASLLFKRCRPAKGVHLALVNTNGRPEQMEQHPSLRWFNHVLVIREKDGETTLLDPTARFLEAGEVRHDLYGKTFFILSNPPRFFTYPRSRTPGSRVELTIGMERAEGDVKVRVEEITSGPLMRWLEPEFRQAAQGTARRRLLERALQMAGAAQDLTLDMAWVDEQKRLHLAYTFVIPQGAPRGSTLRPLQLPGPWRISGEGMTGEAPPYMGAVRFELGDGLRLSSLENPQRDLTSLVWQHGLKHDEGQVKGLVLRSAP